MDIITTHAGWEFLLRYLHFLSGVTWIGAIDLVYRDPSDGEWVVVDYKTDAPASLAKDLRPLLPVAGQEQEKKLVLDTNGIVQLGKLLAESYLE